MIYINNYTVNTISCNDEASKFYLRAYNLSKYRIDSDWIVSDEWNSFIFWMRDKRPYVEVTLTDYKGVSDGTRRGTPV